MVYRVLIVGHSFIHRLESFQFQNRRSGWYNLGFDGTEIQVQFAGLGGGTLRPGPKSIQSERFMQVFHSYQPNSVFLQIGGNDLCREENVEKLARDIRSFAEFLLVAHNVSHVIVGQLLPRYSDGINPRYNVKVIEANKQLTTLFKDRDNISFWKHRGLWKNTESLLTDKVHLNDDGMQIYAKSIRAAVGSFKRR